MDFHSVDDILDYAIKSEEDAAMFYTELAKQMVNDSIREMFEGFAQEEIGHKQKLQRFKAGEQNLGIGRKAISLKIADVVENIKPHDEIGLQEALIIAMKREKQAFELYTSLAEIADDPSAKEVLEGLAEEEAKHKLRFEIEYDEMIMTEN